MDTDEEPRSSNSSYQNIYTEKEETENSQDTTPFWNDSSLPTIAVGNEQWHNLFTQSWVPVLVRDASLQNPAVNYFSF